jgi:hypothetical protein
MLETLSRQAQILGRSVMSSVEEYPWLWIGLIVVTLVILIRRQRGGSL